MPTVDLKGTLGIAADDLWSHVKSFGEVSGFLDIVTESNLIDGNDRQRRCLLADGTELVENLVDQDGNAKSMTYSIMSGLPISDHTATMSVADVGNGRSEFRWITEFNEVEGAPDGFAEMFGSMLGAEVTKLEQRWPVT